MQKLSGNDILCHGAPKYDNPEDASLFLSLGHHVDVYFPPRKRFRVSAPFVLCGEMYKKPQTTIDVLPDECLFEIFRRVSGSQEKSACASVSKRWLTLLSTIRRDEVYVSQTAQPQVPAVAVPVKQPVSSETNKKDGLTASENEAEVLENSGGCLTRCLKGKKATDIRLAAIAVGAGSRGELGELSILGNNASQVTDFGLKAVARGCPSLTALTLWDLSSVGDEGLVEIGNECHLLEKLDLCRCPTISDKSLLAIAKNCPKLSALTIESCSNIGNEGLQAVGHGCPNLKSITIKNCPLVGDQGVAGLLSAASCSLTKVKLQVLNLTDASLAVIGHYGVAVTDLAFGGLCNVTEKGFWVMGNGQGLEQLRSVAISHCSGVTDLSLEAIGKGCPNLRQFCLRKSAYLSDKGIVSFAKAAQSLENLLLDECHRVTQLGVFGLLVNCGTLKALSLAKCSGIKDLPLRTPSLLSPCNNLQSLCIRNCPGFGNISLALLGRLCPQLQHIVFSGLHGITNEGLAPLIQNCKAGLTKLNLSGCVNLTDKLVSEISKVHGRTLKVLNLDGCRSVTDASLVSIAEHCLSLSELDVSGSAITDSGIASLACAAQVNLQILAISGCCQVSDESVPFLRKLGETLFGLNILDCRGLSHATVGRMVEQMWKCDILC